MSIEALPEAGTMPRLVPIRADDASDAAPVYLCPHVPKCAGSTVIDHMRALPDGRFAMMEKPERRAFDQGAAPMLATLSRARFLTGHYLPHAVARLFEGRPVREIALLRDPVGYFRSFYRFYRRQTRRRDRAEAMDFAFWYRCQRRNPVSHFLLSRYWRVGVLRELLMSEDQAFDLLSERLERFWFVGSYRHCDRLLASLSLAFDLPAEVEDRNVSSDAFTLPAPLEDRIRRENRLDQALYEAFADRLWQGGPVGSRPAALPPWPHKALSEARLCLARIERHLRT
ncbi:hypothetical protein [Labrys wisconsinensis]|uniref:Sulfotransferase family protein n=1 Tax=Labrys wisconsinensis TaxID=425677 RepID=A0ABU0JG96_9HYPH|nr:hypothetical protein [Labrys wisconsinensis]MDQ0473321.1 hypothetical protein [Labrys wisconsinensis]